MMLKLFTFGVLLALSVKESISLPVDELNKLEDEVDHIDTIYGELHELKRASRQCPFSSLAGGFPGGAGTPDMTQLLQIARTLLNALDNGGGGLLPGGAEGGSDVETNALSRMRRRRRF